MLLVASYRCTIGLAQQFVSSKMGHYNILKKVKFEN